MRTFQISVLASDHPFYEGPCESLVVPTMDGAYGIQANHYRMISAVVPGILHFTLPGGQVCYAVVSAGIVKCSDNKAVVLVDTAERPEEIEANREKLAMEEAKEMMLQKKSFLEYEQAQTTLARAVNRLKVHRNYTDSDR